MDYHISKGIISERTANNLNAFVRAVWGFPGTVLKRDHRLGLQYIDTMTFPLAFEFLLGRSAIRHKKILVRKEYETALNELETNNVYRRGAFVTGQPGIGKTFFLAYLLVACLGKRRPVAWELVIEYYLVLRDTVTFHSFYETGPLDENSPLWALSDSNDQVRSPNAIFYRLSDVRTIQTTLAKESRWQEWSKQARVECYVMDTWSESEIVDLAKLLDLDVARMTALARSWGGVPRRLLGFLRMEEDEIEEEYRETAVFAVQRCRRALFATVQKNLEENLSDFYFCRPKQTESRIDHKAARAVVPTPTLRRFLGNALQEQYDAVKLDFFRALSQFDETRGDGGYIFESWFHVYISAAQSIQCQWVQGLSGVTPLTGTSTLIPSTWAAVEVARPPCYWVAPENTPGVDSALILDKEIYVFQVTTSSTHRTPIDGLKKLRDHLPVGLKDFGWRVVFIGDEGKAMKPVVRKWVGNLFFPMDQPVVIGWSKVDPVMWGASYREIREESGPMEDAME